MKLKNYRYFSKRIVIEYFIWLTLFLVMILTVFKFDVTQLKMKILYGVLFATAFIIGIDIIRMLYEASGAGTKVIVGKYEEVKEIRSLMRKKLLGYQVIILDNDKKVNVKYYLRRAKKINLKIKKFSRGGDIQHFQKLCLVLMMKKI